jgi:hypothetical protein
VRIFPLSFLLPSRSLPVLWIAKIARGATIAASECRLNGSWVLVQRVGVVPGGGRACGLGGRPLSVGYAQRPDSRAR